MSLEKELTSYYDDLLDALRLSLNGYEIERKGKQVINCLLFD